MTCGQVSGSVSQWDQTTQAVFNQICCGGPSASVCDTLQPTQTFYGSCSDEQYHDKDTCEGNQGTWSSMTCGQVSGSVSQWDQTTQAFFNQVCCGVPSASV